MTTRRPPGPTPRAVPGADRKNTLPDEAKHTLTRRTWMEWIGKATVLSLGTGLLTKCTTDSPGGGDGGVDAGQGPDAALGIDATARPDAGPLPDGGAATDLCTTLPEDVPFVPADRSAEIFQNWPIFTVDPQDLQWILQNWTLTVDGMVEQPRTFTFAEMLGLERQDQVTDFHCVTGWSVLDVPWNGVHLSTLFDEVHPTVGATHVTFHTINDIYNESLPIEVATEPKTLLGYGVNCNTLPLDNGFPLRLVVPRMLAYKSAKYVQRVELTDHAVEGYWITRGYPYDAVVDPSRLREGKY